MLVKDYIIQHNDIYYCEAIIYPDGTIEDARPSHIEALLKATNEDREIINEKMPIEASPAAWLVDYTGCIAIWYNDALLPESFNAKQASTISKLITNNIVKNPYIGYMHKEMSIIKRNKHYLETGEFYEVNKIEIPFYNCTAGEM